MTAETLRDAIEARAREMSFSLVGVAPVDPSGHMVFYASWLARGYHGEMQ